MLTRERLTLGIKKRDSASAANVAYKMMHIIFATILLAPIVGAAALLLKDILAFILCLFLGRSLDFGRRFLMGTLPGALVAAVLCFGLYFLFHKLYSFRFMGTNADLPRSDEL